MEDGLSGFTSRQNFQTNKTNVDFIGYESGSYISSPVALFSIQTASNNRTYFCPIYIYKKQRFDLISMITASSFSGTSSVRLGIYNSSKEHNPSSIFLDAGTVSGTAANTIYSININITLNKGWYFLAFNSQTNAATNNYQFCGNFWSLTNYNRYNDSVNTPVNCLFQDSISGNFNNVTSLLSDTPSCPMIALRVSL